MQRNGGIEYDHVAETPLREMKRNDVVKLSRSSVIAYRRDYSARTEIAYIMEFSAYIYDSRYHFFGEPFRHAVGLVGSSGERVYTGIRVPAITKAEVEFLRVKAFHEGFH